MLLLSDCTTAVTFPLLPIGELGKTTLPNYLLQVVTVLSYTKQTEKYELIV